MDQSAYQVVIEKYEERLRRAPQDVEAMGSILLEASREVVAELHRHVVSTSDLRKAEATLRALEAGEDSPIDDPVFTECRAATAAVDALLEVARHRFEGDLPRALQGTGAASLRYLLRVQPRPNVLPALFLLLLVVFVAWLVWKSSSLA